MFKKKCKCSGCLFRIGRTHRCSLDKRCFLLCKMQQSAKTLNLRDLRILCATQKLIDKIPRFDQSALQYVKENFYV